MIRNIAKWFISRSIDLDKPLPNWVRRRISRDSELRMFAQRSSEISNRLRQDASTWIDSRNERALPYSKRATRPLTANEDSRRANIAQRVLQWSLALAATILVGVGLYSVLKTDYSSNRVSKNELAQPGKLRSSSSAVEAGSAEHSQLGKDFLLSTMRSTSKVLAKLKPAVEESSAANLAIAKSYIDGLPFPKSIATSTDLAGNATGRVLACLNDGMHAEQTQMIDDLKKAADYFSRKLPQRAVKLVGINLR